MRNKIFCFIILLLTFIMPAAAKGSSLDVMPFIFYDSTTGAEFGLVGMEKDVFSRRESLALSLDFIGNGGHDVTALLSFPDKDLRYRTFYPLALDVELSKGKAVADRYYGLGPETPPLNYSYYDDAYSNVRINFSRSMRDNLVLEADLHSADNSFSHVYQGAIPVPPSVQAVSSKYFIAGLGAQFNNTDDPLNPKQGEDLIGNFDAGLKGAGSQAEFLRLKLDLRKYFTPFRPDQVLAGRLALTEAGGAAIPVYEYATLGGRDTLRGYPTYRFRDNAAALFNLEYRFPLLANFGGVFFLDTGKVFNSLTKADLNSWPADVGVGLRYYMQNLILRVDYGVGSEEENLYFFYDHVF